MSGGKKLSNGCKMSAKTFSGLFTKLPFCFCLCFIFFFTFFFLSRFLPVFSPMCWAQIRHLLSAIWRAKETFADCQPNFQLNFGSLAAQTDEVIKQLLARAKTFKLTKDACNEPSGHSSRYRMPQRQICMYGAWEEADVHVNTYMGNTCARNDADVAANVGIERWEYAWKLVFNLQSMG